MDGNPVSPGSVYGRFLAERSSHLAPTTIGFYRSKLPSFVIWCEQNQINDMRQVTRGEMAAFLSVMRKGQRIGRLLNNGALKLHHQCLTTLFNFVGDICNVDADWSSPVTGIKVKASQSQTLEYSQVELDKVFEIIDSLEDRFQQLRNRAIVTVLLNSGVRASELVGMNLGDVSSDGRFKVIGKGSKSRIVAAGSTGLSTIQTYLDVSDLPPSNESS